MKKQPNISNTVILQLRLFPLNLSFSLQPAHALIRSICSANFTVRSHEFIRSLIQAASLKANSTSVLALVGKLSSSPV